MILAVLVLHKQDVMRSVNPAPHRWMQNMRQIQLCDLPASFMSTHCEAVTDRQLHARVTHPEQQGRHEPLGRWAPRRGRRGRRSLAAVCPALVPGLGALPAAPWSSPPLQPRGEAAEAAAPPPPESPTVGPSCRETEGRRRRVRGRFDGGENLIEFDSWATCWKRENTEISRRWAAICGRLLKLFFNYNFYYNFISDFKRKCNKISLLHFQQASQVM